MTLAKGRDTGRRKDAEVQILYRASPEEVKAEQRLTWPQLVRRLAAANATEKALIDYDLRTGAIVIVGGLPAGLTQSVTDVPRGYQCTVTGLLPHERLRLRNGWATISEYHNQRTLSDAVIERFIVRAGFDRVFAVADRMTAPTAIAAE
jgi:hypothetical protein